MTNKDSISIIKAFLMFCLVLILSYSCTKKRCESTKMLTAEFRSTFLFPKDSYWIYGSCNGEVIDSLYMLSQQTYITSEIESNQCFEALEQSFKSTYYNKVLYGESYFNYTNDKINYFGPGHFFYTTDMEIGDTNLEINWIYDNHFDTMKVCDNTFYNVSLFKNDSFYCYVCPVIGAIKKTMTSSVFQDSIFEVSLLRWGARK